MALFLCPAMLNTATETKHNLIQMYSKALILFLVTFLISGPAIYNP